jgi:hypothetical protein
MSDRLEQLELPNARGSQDCVEVLEHAELSNRGLCQETERAGSSAELTVIGGPELALPEDLELVADQVELAADQAEPSLERVRPIAP